MTAREDEKGQGAEDAAALSLLTRRKDRMVETKPALSHRAIDGGF